MPILQNSPLEERNNASQWDWLLERALPALDHVFGKHQEPKKGTIPHWTLGGGTAIALQIGHRISDDIDLFISGAPLSKFTPRENPRAADIAKHPEWPGHSVKFQLTNGEIDFLKNDFQTPDPFTIETFKERQIALETTSEVIAKKVRFRSASFKDRDIFDLVAVYEFDPKIVETLALYVGDKLDGLSHLVKLRHATGKPLTTATIKALPTHEHVLETGPKAALKLIEKAQELNKIVNLIHETDHIGPAAVRGNLVFDWTDVSDQVFAQRKALLMQHKSFVKPQLVSLFKQRSPSDYAAWKAGHGKPSKSRRGSEIGD